MDCVSENRRSWGSRRTLEWPLENLKSRRLWTTFSGDPGARVLQDSDRNNEGGGRRCGEALGAPPSREMGIVAEGGEGARGWDEQGALPAAFLGEAVSQPSPDLRASPRNLPSAKRPKASFCLFSIIFILH